MRKSIRQMFAQHLEDGLNGIVPAANVLPARLVDPAGKSPLVFITSDGTNRARLTTRTLKNEFFVGVFILVLLHDPQNPKWTEELAENLLDDIEEEMNAILINHKSYESLWSQVDYRGESNTERVDFDGHDYVVEYVPLVFTKG